MAPSKAYPCGGADEVGRGVGIGVGGWEGGGRAVGDCEGECPEYCKRRYFRAAKFSRIKPNVTFSRGQIFAHLISISI